jgi:hypothetical protein
MSTAVKEQAKSVLDNKVARLFMRQPPTRGQIIRLKLRKFGQIVLPASVIAGAVAFFASKRGKIDLGNLHGSGSH